MQTRIVTTAAALIAFVVGGATTAAANHGTPSSGFKLGATYEYSYDGCSWNLELKDWAIDPPATVVWDKNHGCHYLTAYIQGKNGAGFYARSGPWNDEQVWANAPFQPCWIEYRGKITTWEHEWTQDSGWKVSNKC